MKNRDSVWCATAARFIRIARFIAIVPIARNAVRMIRWEFQGRRHRTQFVSAPRWERYLPPHPKEMTSFIARENAEKQYKSRFPISV